MQDCTALLLASSPGPRTFMHSSKSKSKLYYDQCQAPIWGPRPDFYFCQFRVCWDGAPSLTRGRICRLQLLLALASIVITSESRRTLVLTFYCQIPDSPNLEGQIPVFISPKNRVVQLYPQVFGCLFVASCDSQGYSGCIQVCLQVGSHA
jgi:hypothetical protein